MATMQQTRASRGAAESDMFATLFKGALMQKVLLKVVKAGWNNGSFNKFQYLMKK